LNQHYPEKFVEISRLFIYYNARTIYGSTGQDTGTSVRAGLKSVKQYGACAESVWPYRLDMFDDRPSNLAYIDAAKRKIKSYSRLRSQEDMLNALSDQKPIVIAMTVFSDFMNLNSTNSIVSMPTVNSTNYGGHAVCIVGYDLNRQLFLVKNSFGTKWGDQGYCWIPFEYIDEYAFEQWVFDILIQD
jgi:hypothetical protein